MTDIAGTRMWDALLDTLEVRCGSAQRHRCTADWAIHNRVIHDEMLHLVEQGTVQFSIGGQVCTARPGQLIICPPGIAWSAIRVSQELLQLSVIHFGAVLAGEQRYFQALGFPYLIIPPEPQRIESAISELCLLYAGHHSGYVLKSRAVLYGLLFQILDQRGVHPLSKPTDQLVLRLIHFLKSNLDRPLSRDDLGRQVGLDPAYMALLFRRYTGYSPIDYLIRLRLDEACKLLSSGNLPVAAVARQVGYEDSAYFSRLFRRVHGLSPRLYRLEQRMRSN